MTHDLRYAFRSLLHSPAFTLAAIVTLALGIGANTAIFSAIDAVLLKPLPFPEPDQLVVISGRDADGQLGAFTGADLIDLRTQAQSFEHLAAYRETSFNLTGQDRPERVTGAVASTDFFATFRAQALLGRTLSPALDRPAGPRTAVLSYRLWQRRYGGEQGIAGKTTIVDGEPATIVGVMPPSFQFPAASDLWLSPRFLLPEHPLVPNNDPSLNRSSHYLQTIARVKTGVTLAQARTESNAIVARLKSLYKDDEEHVGASLVPLHDELAGSSRTALLMLLGAVGMLLLIACANVANLVLARGATRQKEIVIRVALGAGRARVVRQLLTESLMLALAGGAVGILLGEFAVKPLGAMVPAELLGGTALQLDSRVLAFTLVIALASGIVFGLLPALQMARPDLNSVLKEGNRGTASGSHAYRTRSLLVIVEIALAAILLVGAGLLIRSFSRLLAVPGGFNPEHVLTLQLSLPQGSYPKPDDRAAFVQQMLDRVGVTPGVASASVISRLPLKSGSSTRSMTVQGRTTLPADPAPDYLSVGPHYFESMGIRILKGRTFTARDTAAAPRVVVVTEATARRFWPDSDPVGQRVTIGKCAAGEQDWCQVIGVVADVQQHALNELPKPAVYVAYAQDPWPFMAVVVRTRTDPASAATAVESAIHSVDKDQPVYGVRTMQAVVAASVSPARLRMLLLGIFAAVALALASVGIYGVMAYSVSQRKHEIGIRMALGAAPGDVRRLIAGQAARLALAGVCAGLVVSVGLARYMASLLFGIQPVDLPTLAVISILLVAVALMASWIPVWRATRLDPVSALRNE